MTRRRLSAAFACALASGPALAQVVERNLPPAPAASAAAFRTLDNILPAEEDDTPIGPALSGLTLLGPTDPVVAAGASGVDTHRVARLDTPAMRARLANYLGRPLSRRLIAEIQAEIARYYRARGFPFVSLTTPEHEITGGSLQIRVVEFTVGELAVTGAGAREADIRERVRQRPGQPIDTKALSQDLEWINRGPFRQTEALFSPGDGLGRSDLTLAVRETKPWRAYAGVSNNGGSAADRMRIFAGLQAAPLRASPDTVLAYQATSSDDVFDSGLAAYLSHAFLATLGVAPRHAVEASLSHVETNQEVAPFAVRHRIWEGSLGWRGAAGALGDIRLGVEARHAERDISFGGAPALAAEIGVFQTYAGMERRATDRLGASLISATLRFSPGGVGGDNSAADFAAYTGGRVTDASYGYAEAFYSRTTRLDRRFTLASDLIARLATGRLPDTEQIGIGGASLVRGYMLEDGGYDDGVVLRNTLTGPSTALFSSEDLFRPHLFADIGHGNVRGAGDSTLASAGIGGVLTAGPAAARLDVAHAFKDAPQTQSGDWRAHFNITVGF